MTKWGDIDKMDKQVLMLPVFYGYMIKLTTMLFNKSFLNNFVKDYLMYIRNVEITAPTKRAIKYFLGLFKSNLFSYKFRTRANECKQFS